MQALHASHLVDRPFQRHSAIFSLGLWAHLIILGMQKDVETQKAQKRQENTKSQKKKYPSFSHPTPCGASKSSGVPDIKTIKNPRRSLLAIPNLNTKTRSHWAKASSAAGEGCIDALNTLFPPIVLEAISYLLKRAHCSLFSSQLECERKEVIDKSRLLVVHFFFSSTFLRFPLGAGSKGVRLYVIVRVTTCRTVTGRAQEEHREASRYRTLVSTGQSAGGEAAERKEALRGDSVTGEPFADAEILNGRNLIGVLGIL